MNHYEVTQLINHLKTLPKDDNDREMIEFYERKKAELLCEICADFNKIVVGE
jgi:hypothetical protein